MLPSVSNRPRPRFNLLLCLGGLVLMFGGFGFAGLFGLGSLISYANNGPVSGLIVGLAVVAAATCVGGVVLITRQVRRLGPQEVPPESHPGEPWLLRDDWEQHHSREGRGRAGVFRFEAMPGVLGGRLRGRIEFPEPPPGPHRFVLTCSRHRHTNHGAPDLLWSDEAAATFHPDAVGFAAEVDFEIPFDAPPTGDTPAGGIAWDVCVMRGKHDVAGFFVPVYRTGASNPLRTKAVLERETGARLLASSFEPGRIRTSPTATGAVYRTHAGKDRKSAFSALACALFFGAFAYALQAGAHAPGAIVKLLGGIGLLAFWAALWLMFGKLSTETSANGLRVRSSCLVYSRTREATVSQITGFAIEYGQSAGFRLHVLLKNDRRVTCATGLEKPEALWLAARIRRDLPALSTQTT